MLKPELATKIVHEVKRLLDESIIVVNTDGIIMASTDKERIGNFHEGAYIVSREKKTIFISKEDETKYRGVKAGINMPVLFKHEVVGVIGITGDPQKVSPYGEILKKMTELLIQESYFHDQFEWRSRAIETFVFDWLQLREWNEVHLNRATILGINLQCDRTLCLLSLDGTILGNEIWAYVMNWNEQNEKDIYLRWGNDRILCLLDATTQRRESIKQKVQTFAHALQSHFPVAVSAGIGNITEPLQIKKSYGKAEKALHVAKRNHQVLFEDDLTLEVLFQNVDAESRKEFISRTISALLENEELLQTLVTYYDKDLSIKETSEALHIHINTLHYRLKKIEELIGLQPRKTAHINILCTALLFLDEYPINVS